MRNKSVRSAAPVACLVAALALVCAGCGGGSGGATGHRKATASTDGPPFPKAAAKSAARKALFVIGDFPSGWSTSKQDTGGAGEKDAQSRLAACLHVPAGVFAGSGPDSVEVETPNFDSADGNVTISESVSVSRTKDVDEGFAALRRSNATTCLASVMNTYMKASMAQSDDEALKSATLGDLTVGQLSTDKYGDDTLGLRVTVPVSTSGLTINVTIDTVYIRHANAVADVQFESLETPISAKVSTPYLRLAAKRLEGITIPAGTA